MNRKKGNRQDIKIYIFVFLFSIVFLVVGNSIASSHKTNLTIPDYESELENQVFAKVVKVDSVTPNPDDSSTDILQFTATITAGKQKGTSVQATQYVYKNNDTMPSAVKANDNVVLASLSTNGATEWAFENYNRIGQIAILVFVFAAFVLILGGWKGMSTILSLTFTCLSLFYVYIPFLIAGYNIYAATVIICIYIIGISFIFTGGVNQKSLAAAIGCAGGVVFSGVIYRYMEAVMKLTGYYNDETSRLFQIFGQGNLNLKGVVFAMVTIGALGGTMDVAMSIASSLDEIRTERVVTKYDLIRSGLNIGKDIMGTMANTLILAYIGSSLVMVLIYGVSNYPLFQLLNKEEIIIEMLQSLIGSLGMLFTIPFTTVVSSILFTARKEEAEPLPYGRKQQTGMKRPGGYRQ
jgi:uncharacterized membrane protein